MINGDIEGGVRGFLTDNSGVAGGDVAVGTLDSRKTSVQNAGSSNVNVQVNVTSPRSRSPQPPEKTGSGDENGGFENEEDHNFRFVKERAAFLVALMEQGNEIKSLHAKLTEKKRVVEMQKGGISHLRSELSAVTFRGRELEAKAEQERKELERALENKCHALQEVQDQKSNCETQMRKYEDEVSVLNSKLVAEVRIRRLMETNAEVLRSREEQKKKEEKVSGKSRRDVLGWNTQSSGETWHRRNESGTNLKELEDLVSKQKTEISSLNVKLSEEIQSRKDLELRAKDERKILREEFEEERRLLRVQIKELKNLLESSVTIEVVDQNIDSGTSIDSSEENSTLSTSCYQPRPIEAEIPSSEPVDLEIPEGNPKEGRETYSDSAALNPSSSDPDQSRVFPSSISSSAIDIRFQDVEPETRATSEMMMDRSSSPQILNFTGSIVDDFVKLSSITGCRLNLDVIVESVRSSLQFIEPWNKVTSDNQTVVLAIKDIRVQSNACCLALEKISQTADYGYQFCGKSKKLCVMLLNESTTSRGLAEFVSELGDMAHSAAGAAADASAMFRLIRTELIEIGENIKQDVKHLIVHRKAIVCLHDAANGLVTLFKNVDAFAKWWFDMNTTLKVLQTRASASPSLKIINPRLKSIQNRWEEIGVQYREYLRQVSRLRDVYRVDAGT